MGNATEYASVLNAETNLEHEGLVRLPVTWSYDASDPLAVSLVFDEGVGIKWTFALDLVTEALGGEEVAGVGDVQVLRQGHELGVKLSSPLQVMLFAFNADDVRNFVANVEAFKLDTDLVVDLALEKFLSE